MFIIFTAVSLALIVIVLGFSGWLNIVSFKKNYVNSLVASYAVAGGETKRKIEYAVKYGKPLANFYGMQELLTEAASYSSDIENVQIILPDGQILYALGEGGTGNFISPQMAKKVDFQVDLPKYDYIYVLQDGKYHVFIPIRDRQNNWIASLDMVFNESLVNGEVEGYIGPISKVMLLIGLVASCLLIALLWCIPILDSTGKIRQKRLLAIFICVLGAAQLAYAAANTNSFKVAYLDIAQKNTMLSATIIKKDITRVVELGVPYKRLAGMEEWLQRIISSVPEIESVYVKDLEGRIIHSAPMGKGSPPAEQSLFQYSVPLAADSTGVQGKLQIVLSEGYIGDKIRDILLDALTVSLISFFFMVEFLLFILLFVKGKVATSTGQEEETVRGNMIRPLAFLFFVATDMSISFIPMQMKSLYEPLLGLSQQALIALPISMEMLCASLTAISTGFIIDKKGWRLPFFIGLAFLFMGVLLSGLAWSGLVFILARGLVGTGFGFAWMAMRGYVAANPTSGAKAKGFAQMNAGIYAGNICACAFGAMLAERVGYSGVFFIALVVVGLVAIFAAFLVKDPAPLSVRELPREKMTNKVWGNFFSDAGVLGLFLLITIPSALCLTGFLNYFFPIYSNQLNLSPANIGRAFMIYGICIVYLGPFFGKIIAQSQNIRTLIVSGSCIGVTALLLFAWQGGIVAAIVAIVLFGIADSIGFIAQNTFLLSLSATKKFGDGKALGFFSMTKKLGQMLGPIIFAWAIGFGGVEGLGWIGIAYLGTVIFFFLGTRQIGKNVVPSRE